MSDPPPDVRRAIALAIATAIVLPVVDAMVKRLVADYPVVMVAWVRMGLIVVFLGIVGGARLGTRMLRPVAWRLQILRGLSAVLGTVMVFLGFRAIPLAECLAIVAIAPVLSNLFARWWLAEPGDGWSWAMALLSFAGVLVIVRPGTGVWASAAVYPVIGAIGLAGFLTITRAVAGRDDPRVTAFFGPLVSFLAFSTVMPFNWVTPKSAIHLALFAGIGALAALAQVLQTLAYRHGTTHQIAPFAYLSVIVSVFVGWAAFGAIPDGWSIAGMAVIVVAGVGAALRR